jgi:hypothetical protein
MSCPDPTAPDVYVSFGQPSTKDGFVMVAPLADKPLGYSVKRWLDEVKRSVNLNPIISERPVSVNGLVGLRVRYKNEQMHIEMDETYFVVGSKTFKIGFGGEIPDKKVEDLPNYSLYERMVATFEVKKP